MNNSKKIKDALNKSFKELPVAKDLPRLAKRISIRNEGHLVLTSTPEISIPDYLFKIFMILSRLLRIETHIYTKMEEGWKTCWEEEENTEIEKIMVRFLEEYVGDENRVIRVLKSCNQAVIANAIIELKLALGANNATKDVPDSWFLVISVQQDRVIVENKKREQSLLGIFQFEWALTIVYDMDTITCHEVTLRITDFIAMVDKSDRKLIEVKSILKKYWDVDGELSRKKLKLIFDYQNLDVNNNQEEEKRILKEENVQYMTPNCPILSNIWIPIIDFCSCMFGSSDLRLS